MELLAITAFDVVVATRIHDGDLAFGDGIGHFVVEVGVIKGLNIRDDVARQNEEVVMLHEGGGLRGLR